MFLPRVGALFLLLPFFPVLVNSPEIVQTPPPRSRLGWTSQRKRNSRIHSLLNSVGAEYPGYSCCELGRATHAGHCILILLHVMVPSVISQLGRTQTDFFASSNVTLNDVTLGFPFSLFRYRSLQVTRACSTRNRFLWRPLWLLSSDLKQTCGRCETLENKSARICCGLIFGLIFGLMFMRHSSMQLCWGPAHISFFFVMFCGKPAGHQASFRSAAPKHYRFF